MRKFVGLLLLLTSFVNAHATLGEGAATVALDRQRLKAQLLQANERGVVIFTLLSENDMTVREYADASGFVFAVAWDGPTLPDLPVLLGSYFPDYVKTFHGKTRGTALRQTQLVIESGGRMGAYLGRAYLPNKLPRSWLEQDIR